MQWAESQCRDVGGGQAHVGGVAARRSGALSSSLLGFGFAIFGSRVSGAVRTRASGGGIPLSVPSQIPFCRDVLGAVGLGPHCPG